MQAGTIYNTIIKEKLILIKEKLILIKEKLILIKEKLILIKEKLILIKEKLILIKEKLILIKGTQGPCYCLAMPRDSPLWTGGGLPVDCSSSECISSWWLCTQVGNTT